MIGNSGKLPGLTGATDLVKNKLNSTQQGFSPKLNDSKLMIDGMAPTNLLGGRKYDKSGADKQLSRKNLAVNS